MKIVVSRGTVVPFSDLPPKSIALDGYCQGPEIDNENERYSFDHHENCTRFATFATCQQVLHALNLGLDPADFTIFVNDVDCDTVVSAWLLMHPEASKDPQIRKLVNIAGMIDAFGPAYPVNSEITSDLFYGVMAPQVAHARAKTYGTCDLEELFFECIKRLGLYQAGELEMEPTPDTPKIEIVDQGTGGWSLVKCDGFGAFQVCYDQGITKAVIMTEKPDGSIMYTIGKKSEFVAGFPVGPSNQEGTILHALNEAEKGWGGSSTIGGSPRNEDGSSSRLSPSQVFDIVEKAINF